MKTTPLMMATAAILIFSRPIGGQDAQHSPASELDIEMFYQFSLTGNDAEVTIEVESPKAIDTLSIVGPHDRRVATVRSSDALGLAKVELESAEPSVEEVQRAYPEGTYRFSGRAVDGSRLRGRIGLTHDVIDAPDFFTFSPCDEEVDSSNPIIIQWHPVAGGGGYEIIIEQDDTGANLRVTLSGDKTSFVIPQEFLAPGLDYEIEMKSVTAGGNKTSASCEFGTL